MSNAANENSKVVLTASPEIKVNIVGSGPRGMPGKSAYQIWLDEGHTGSKEDFLESLKGEDGYTPIKGIDYFDGEKGDTPSIAHLEYATMQATSNMNATNELIVVQEQQRVLAEQQRVLAEQQRQKNKIVVSDTEPTDSIFWLDTSQN